MRGLLIVLFAGLALLPACAGLDAGSAPAPTRLEQIAKGRELATEHCSTCHAIGAAGDSPAEEAPPWRDIADTFTPTTLNGLLSQGISARHPTMPAFEFSRSDAEALSAYLHSVQAQAHPHH